MNKTLIGWAVGALLALGAFWAAQHQAVAAANFRQKAHVADSLRKASTDSLRKTEIALHVSQMARDMVEQQLKSKQIRVVTVVQKASEDAKSLPDTCQPVIHALQQANDSLQSVADSGFSLYEQQKQATARLQAAAQPVVTAVEAAHEAIKAAPGRSFWSHLIPKATVGPFAGVCTDSKPCAGVGVTLGWSI